jgi:carbon dioxide concentrating mechanism protein CcmN
MKSSLRAISLELPSFPLVSSDRICVIGNVSIDPHTAIAPGVVIQAAENSQVIIEAGVCIGIGTVIKADQGKIVIEQGAILGARVLMMGQGKIGSHACIGAATTIFNHSVAQMEVIEAYSILGDSSRQVNLEVTEATTESETIKPEEKTTVQEASQVSATVSPSAIATPELEALEETKTVHPTPDPWVNDVEIEPEIEQVFENSEPQTATPSTSATKSPVVGQVYINNLLLTLFPNRQSINIPANNDAEE